MLGGVLCVINPGIERRRWVGTQLSKAHHDVWLEDSDGGFGGKEVPNVASAAGARFAGQVYFKVNN